MARAASTSWGRYGSVVGSGAHCAAAPATSGPAPNPTVMAAPARLAPEPAAACSCGGADSSLIQALPALNAQPLATPMMSRPANRQSAPCAANISTTAATADSATEKVTTGRRPIRSDTRPATSSPGIRPIAYMPNVASTVAVLRPSNGR